MTTYEIITSILSTVASVCILAVTIKAIRKL